MESTPNKRPNLAVAHRGDTYVLSGSVNEFADFSFFEKEPGTLKLNLHDIKHLNSLGILRILQAIDKRGGRPFEYYECTQEFIAQINLLPALLGQRIRPQPGKVISVYCGYTCDKCDKDYEHLVAVADVKIENDSIKPPVQVCPDCGQKIYANDPEDVFTFLRFG